MGKLRGDRKHKKLYNKYESSVPGSKRESKLLEKIIKLEKKIFGGKDDWYY